MPVIAAREFDNFIAPGDAACQANSGHGGFGAGRYHTYLFDCAGDRGVDAIDHKLCELCLGRGCGTKRQPA